LHATRCAEKEGVVPGGGVALARCETNFVWDGDEHIGAKILNTALLAPLRTLAENAGEPPELIIRGVEKTLGSWGWNARTNEFGDMIEMGILDPLRVVRVALESAASVAALMLITSTLVSNERK
jgi:chaperonin GroEL